MKTAEAILKADQVTAGYGRVPLLRDVSLSITQPEFIGVLGPNGSGKTTLMKTLSGYLKPKSGTVFIKGSDVARMSRQTAARSVGWVSSEASFLFPYTAREIVLMGRLPYQNNAWRFSETDHAVADEAMHCTDVWELRGEGIHRLSSGQRQRVLIARALAQEPDVLLMDEPSAHLDFVQEQRLMDLLQQLVQKQKRAVVCVFHDLELAKRFCSRVVLLKAGAVVADGTPEQQLHPKVINAIFNMTRSRARVPASKRKGVL